MKNLYLFFITAIVLLSSCSDLTNPGIDKNSGTQRSSTSKETSAVKSKSTSALQTDSDVWVGAYLASYNHYAPPTGNWGNLPTDEIDWDAFTHLYYFSLNAKADGSLSIIEPYQNMSPDRINAIVSAAHDAGKPVMFTVGGWGNYNGFSKAISPGVRSIFISNLVATMKTWGFDGIDLDMEPIQSGDVDNYIAFINELNTALQTVDVPMVSEPLISVVTNWHPDIFGQISDKVDHVNLMTYDLSGAWQGWVSWHNAAVYSGGLSFPSSGKPLPSIDEKVKAFIEAGVPASKLGIGIDFYGYVWSGGSGTSTGGVTKPNQDWTTAPTVTDNVSYHKIMDQYYQSGNYRWDDQAKAAYLSIDEAGSANDKFISYDDEKTIQAKFDYVRQKGLGGTIIWELSGGYRKDQPAGERDNLLQAVKSAMNNSGGIISTPTLDTSKPSISINAPIDGATLSGTVDIDVQASDNVGITNVELYLDGSLIKNYSSAPYTYSWNTTNHSDHTCTLEVKAFDAAGNIASSTRSVTVDNTSITDSSGSSTSGGTSIYEESLNSSWYNVSWSASIDFNNSEQSLSGSRSIKVNQNSWGALSLRNGNWGQGRDIDPAKYEAVELSVYALNQDATISLMLENDLGQKFPRIAYGSVSANRWVTVRIPLNELDPEGQIFHRLDVLETSGSSKTYYVDDIKLIGNGTVSSSTKAGSGDSSPGSTTPDPGTNTFIDVYSDQLETPWINSSWNATIDFNNSTNVSAGSKSIRVDQNSWGALSLHSGNWGNTVDLNTSNYKRLELKVYTPDSDVSFNIALKSDDSDTPTYQSGSIPANQWVTLSIPMTELNPNSNIIQRLNIVENSGSKKTYYIDDLRFVK